MDFANESYVRVYTRDTMSWKRLNWQARAVLVLLFRKLDRAGVLDLEGLDPVEAVSLATELPVDVVEAGLPKLLERGTLVARAGALISPRFMEAQECSKSDALRSKEYRERRRSQALSEPSQDVTPESQDVTGASREITERHAATETSREHHSLLCSADPLLPSAVLASADRAHEDVRQDWKVGYDWFVATFLSGDPTQAPNVGKWRDDYATLGRKPEAERATVAKVASADPWVIANRGGSADPGHFVKHWGRYKTGGQKTVARPPSSAEQAEAGRKAAAGSRLVEVQRDFARRIKAARDDGDPYTAETLAAERDLVVTRLQSQAS